MWDCGCGREGGDGRTGEVLTSKWVGLVDSLTLSRVICIIMCVLGAVTELS